MLTCALQQQVTLSYLQIYQEKIYDLLNSTNKVDLALREHPDKGLSCKTRSCRTASGSSAREQSYLHPHPWPQPHHVTPHATPTYLILTSISLTIQNPENGYGALSKPRPAILVVTSIGQHWSPWACNSVKVKMKFYLERNLHFPKVCNLCCNKCI